MKIYHVCQWQTKGVLEDDAKPVYSTYPKMLKSTTQNKWYLNYQWFETEAEANKKAEELRLKNIQSLKKKLEKLEKMSFNNWNEKTNPPPHPTVRAIG